MKIAIAGASGFIGQSLVKKILEGSTHEVVALSRSDLNFKHPRLIHRSIDLFSLKESEEALKGCDIAYYLVHSMLPTAGLDQGHFYDYDLLLADNFTRAAQLNGVKEIIYLSGLQPNQKNLSWHLKSRLEVEETFMQSGLCVKILRAGIIIGANGSSFEMIRTLVERLPVMLCPSWTQTMTQACDQDDLIETLEMLYSNPASGVYEIGYAESLSYLDIMKKTASSMGLKRYFFQVPYFSLALSKGWVTLITGAPMSLVGPLIKSLKFPMLLGQHKNVTSIRVGNIDETLKKIIQTKKGSVHAYQKRRLTTLPIVRSVQRLPLPPGMNAEDVALDYFQWLPRLFRYFIQVRIEGLKCIFWIPFLNLDLLVLNRKPERGDENRALLMIEGGVLAKSDDKARLEFRVLLGKKYVMSAIHHFRPALPWFIYRYSQAVIHLLVMNAFSRYLKKKKDQHERK